MQFSQSSHSIALRRWHKRPAQVKGHPQTGCSIFGDSSALEDSLVQCPCTASPVVQNSTHFDQDSGNSYHSPRIDQPPLQGLLQLPVERETSAFVKEQFVWKRTNPPNGGQLWGKFLTEFTFWKGGKEETTSAVDFSPPSTTYASLLGNVLFYILIPEIEERFHTQTRKSTSGSLTSPDPGLSRPAIH